MKPGPEHVGRRFCDIEGDSESELVGIEGGLVRLRPTEGGDEFVMTMSAFSRFWKLAEEPAVPLAAVPALLSRLLAAGFDDVEIALRATAADPLLPSYRLIGYWREERVSCTAIASDEGDLGRIEAAVIEKLEALKAAESVARPPSQQQHDDGDEPRFMGVPIRLPAPKPPKDGGS